jgi:hypothetical protein
MNILKGIEYALTNWVNRRYIERELTRYIANSHHDVVMATLRSEFPELGGESISAGLVSSLVRRANQRLLEHII